MSRILIALAASAVLALVPQTATAAKHSRPAGKDRVQAVYRDCGSARTGKLRHRFKLTTLRRARRHMPADLAAYTDCDATIRREIKQRR